MKNFDAGIVAIEVRDADKKGTTSEFYYVGSINSCMGLSNRLSNRIEDAAEGWGNFDPEAADDDEEEESPT